MNTAEHMNTETYEEHRALNKAVLNLYSTIQDRNERLKHMPARKRAKLKKRLDNAFSAWAKI